MYEGTSIFKPLNHSGLNVRIIDYQWDPSIGVIKVILDQSPSCKGVDS